MTDLEQKDLEKKRDEVKEYLIEKLKLGPGTPSWFNGIGDTLDEDGNPAVAIRLLHKNGLKYFPAEIDGVKLDVLVVGQVSTDW